MSGRFQNKKILITGGNSGIGRATAELFVREGAQVIITGRDSNTIENTVKELGHGVIGLKSDSGNLKDIHGLVSEIQKRWEFLDAVFVNAGVALFAPFEQSSEELFDQTFQTNIKGPYFLIQKLLPMLKSGSAIVLNASVVTKMGMPNSSVYTASKAALSSLGKTLASELVSKGIRVNVVNPGPIATPIYGRMGLPKEAINQMSENIQSQVPMQRFGESKDIANAVAFLSGEDSSYITGIEISVDGGMSEL